MCQLSWAEACWRALLSRYNPLFLYPPLFLGTPAPTVVQLLIRGSMLSLAFLGFGELLGCKDNTLGKICPRAVEKFEKKMRQIGHITVHERHRGWEKQTKKGSRHTKEVLLPSIGSTRERSLFSHQDRPFGIERPVLVSFTEKRTVILENLLLLLLRLVHVKKTGLKKVVETNAAVL